MATAMYRPACLLTKVLALLVSECENVFKVFFLAHGEMEPEEMSKFFDLLFSSKSEQGCQSFSPNAKSPASPNPGTM